MTGVLPVPELRLHPQKIKVTVTKQGKENTPMKYRPKHRKQPWWHRLIFGRRMNPYQLLNEISGTNRNAR
ncbi:hypothetical protein [Corynebacterium belfantii]|uniref:Uncharacterized protein n=1 Tax=Corynebacterium belfantii TaxID=2014537 RepID=A0ABS0LCL4_9CORY|nr:hypothetical protein [Corynebacterium belfantii]MBG9309882.1 hypothetical protein [Corynebacterium belfantii]MBG9354366.1 hypothetical protein [Corynebacterium belfantii]SPJ40161.1 hypothetical protein CHUV2995_00948 [Corynebacterium diphtheriae subsp. lausannense]